MDTIIPPRQESARETPYFLGRLRILGLLGAFLLFILTSRLTYLCILHGEEFLDRSQSQVSRKESIPAPRGIIFDRFGRLLATNRITYSVFLSPHNLTSDTLSRSVGRLEELTGLKVDPAKTHKRFAPRENPNKPFTLPFTNYLLAEGLSWEQATIIAERQTLEMPGLSVVETFERTYEKHCTQRALSHVIGYISKLSPNDVKRERAEGREVDPERDRIGKKNIEAYYDEELRGNKGLQLQNYDVRERPIGDPTITKSAESGANLVLTLDADLQMRGTELMRPFGRMAEDERGKPMMLGGALVAMDPRDGEVLALVSIPDYNYARKDGQLQDEYNRAIDGRYSPGSTYKLVTASAALQEGYSPGMTISCNKRWRLGTQPFKCLFVHGPLDMYNALRASCNVYFFELATRLRWGPIADASLEYGFGQSPRLDIGSGGKPQILRLPRQGEEDVCVGDVVQMAIGQGSYIEVSPLQMCVAYAAVGNKEGLRMRPHLLKEIIHPDGEHEVPQRDPGKPSPASDPAVRENLIIGFRKVVEKRGTADEAGFDPAWKVAGKTGSAEYFGCEPGKENAWFIGFAPWDNPEICVAVLCERSGHGGEVAAPVAAQFLKTYFEVTRPRLLDPTSRPVFTSLESGDALASRPASGPASLPASQPADSFTESFAE